MNCFLVCVVALSATCSLSALAHDVPPGPSPRLSSVGQIDEDVLAQRLRIVGVTRVISKQSAADKTVIVADKNGQIVRFELDKHTGILKEAPIPAAR